MSSSKKLEIYLDYASSTPVREEVLKVMEPYWQDNFANPQAVHKLGRVASEAVDKAREGIAEVLGGRPSEIIFTSGATESNSLALMGGVRAFTYKKEAKSQPEVLVSEITHSSVRNIDMAYPDEISMQELSVRTDGRLKVDEIVSEINDTTAVLSFSHANSEIGTYQPVSDIVQEVKKYRRNNNSQYPLIHIDASQSALYKSVQSEELGADLLTINSQKIYGPKGVGLLWVKSGTPLSPIFFSSSNYQVGDYQKLRPGTQPVSLIVGMQTAIRWAQDNYHDCTEAVGALQDYFIESLRSTFPDVRINGSLQNRVPNNISATFSDVNHDYLATLLDAEGIVVATTSACQAIGGQGSKVLQAVNDDDQALRFSLGNENTKAEIDEVIKTLEEIFNKQTLNNKNSQISRE